MPIDVDRLRNALADRYAIEREIGRGGMAVVYLAEDLKHGRQVAVKVLEPELASSLGSDRFLREIETAARLNHPHILPLYDSGEAGGFIYYAMPYMEGDSLRDRLDREGQLPVDEAVRIAQEVADGLDYAHEQGVLHRDIKPGNIMLSRGHAVIADFGIAWAVDEAGGERVTRTGISLGSPTYMSPEQASGTETVDARTDVYSLACVLYEMLAGEPPYTGKTAAAIMARKVLDVAPSLRVMRDTVPPGVEQAVAKALARVPADRFATAGQVAEALQAAPASARGADVERGRPPKRQRHRWAAAVGALAVVAIGAAVITLQSRRPQRNLNQDVITVLPFASPGGNERVQELAGQLPEAFWTVLDGKYGPRVSDLGTVRAKWSEAGGMVTRPVPQAAALRIAEEVGAGKLVLGTVTGTEDRLTLTATLLEVPNGQPRVFRSSVTGPLDQFATLVDSLIVQLLATDFGEIGERLPHLSAHSNAAVLAYLAGNYLDALALDSTFTLAAMKAYSVELKEQDQAMAQFVWDRREQLGPRDGAYFTVLAGWRFGATPDVVTWVAQFDSARALSSEGWFVRIDQLDKLVFFAPSTDLDWAERAHGVLEELHEIDSLRVRCMPYEDLLAAVELDTAGFRRYWDACAQSRGHPSLAEARGWDLAVGARWVLAHLADDSTAMAASRAELGALDEEALASHWVSVLLNGPRLHGRGVEDVDRVAAARRNRDAWAWQDQWARWRGRHREFRDYRASALWETNPEGQARAPMLNTAATVGAALFLDLPMDASVLSAADTLRQVASGAIDPGIVPNDPASETGFRTMAVCWSTLWQLLEEGDTHGARDAADYLRTEAKLPHRWASCAGMIEVLADQREGGDVHGALVSLDSLMRRGPDPIPFSGGLLIPDGIANLLLARQLVQYGDTTAAIAAARRRPYPAISYHSELLFPEFLREEGRLLALAGDETGAIEAYNLYLRLRDQPSDYEPWEAERQAVQEELAALVAQQSAGGTE